MAVHQLSLFVENRSGTLRGPCDALARAGVDILTASLADTERFGVLRLVVDDPDRAREALEATGAVVQVTEVVVVEVDDRPGGLSAALTAIDGVGMGVEYLYAFGGGPRPGKAAIVFRFEDPARAAAAIRERGLRVLEAADLVRAGPAKR